MDRVYDGGRGAVALVRYGISWEGFYVSEGRDRKGVSVGVMWPILDYGGMTPGNNFETDYYLEVIPWESVPWERITWTRKVPLEMKNTHRAAWGMTAVRRKESNKDEEGAGEFWDRLFKGVY